jgi:nucleoside-diphosphate-sugar epimerase
MSKSKALVIGGTGPTGPHIVEGLLRRDYEVVLFHRGTHEVPEMPEVEHIHGDPHFAETIADALAGRTFDIVVATYGRIAAIAEWCVGRCRQLITVGGVPVYRGYLEPHTLQPRGLAILADETAPLASRDADASIMGIFSYKVAQAEQAVFDRHRKGAYLGTVFRYPYCYGPRQVGVSDWSVIKRVRDRREFIVVADGGLTILTRIALRNAANAIMCAVDKPEAAAGHAYNCGDDQQYSMRQWIELLAHACGGSIEVVSLPDEIAWPARPFYPLQRASDHGMVSTERIRSELGYSDVITPVDAIEEMVDWYDRNPPAMGSFKGSDDMFAYADEDRLVSAYRSAIGDISSRCPPVLAEVFHPQPHPKVPKSALDHRGR